MTTRKLYTIVRLFVRKLLCEKIPTNELRDPASKIQPFIIIPIFYKTDYYMRSASLLSPTQTLSHKENERERNAARYSKFFVRATTIKLFLHQQTKQT